MWCVFVLCVGGRPIIIKRPAALRDWISDLKVKFHSSNHWAVLYYSYTKKIGTADIWNLPSKTFQPLGKKEKKERSFYLGSEQNSIGACHLKIWKFPVRSTVQKWSEHACTGKKNVKPHFFFFSFLFLHSFSWPI